MNGFPIEVGRVAYSLAGRDRGRAMLIVAVLDAQHVHLVDGSLRTLARPKKKKIRHVRATSVYFTSIAETISSGKPLLDAQVRHCLAQEEVIKCKAPCEGG